ncbi:hypothetical protein [Aestuariivirga sp.]|uniref:hypothetical protein n=1 Tax=Aestuariivirga sp. TaxID=2650926 RepID=UPI003919EA53
MKLILSAAALLAVIAMPAVAEDAVVAQPQPQAPAVEDIVPAATQPAMSEAQPGTETGSQSKASAKDHGCGSRQTVYLTN